MRYFLNGVARQSEDALNRVERLIQLKTDWRENLSGQAGTKAALQLLDMVAANPFLTPRGAQDKLGLAYNTVMRAIGQLEKLKVLKEVSEAKRDRVFCTKSILDTLEDPRALLRIPLRDSLLGDHPRLAKSWVPCTEPSHSPSKPNRWLISDAQTLVTELANF